MKKALMHIGMLMLCLTFAAQEALASPGLYTDQYTAYLGELNHLFIYDHITRELRTLQTSVEDILSIANGHLYCLAKGGTLYAVRLDGSGSSVISSAPTQEDWARYGEHKPYTLENGALHAIINGISYQIAPRFITAAISYRQWLYYSELTPNGAVLKRFNLADMYAGIDHVGPAYLTPAALAVSDTKLIALAADGQATIYDLTGHSAMHLTLPYSSAKALVIAEDTLLCYDIDSTTGHAVYAAQVTLTHLNTLPYSQANETPVPTTIPAHTAATPAVPSTPSPPPAYTAVSHGQTGTQVRNMQQRLKQLGYPISSIDGHFGPQTLRALKLFQEQAGYKESATASSALLNELYNASAPKFDLYKACKPGSAGERVRMLQERLRQLKYDEVGIADGSYGSKTAFAVKRFQRLAGLPETGLADRDTMRILYSDTAPVNKADPPTDMPAGIPTDALTEAPTDIPAADPVTPVPLPTEDPAETIEP